MVTAYDSSGMLKDLTRHYWICFSTGLQREEEGKSFTPLPPPAPKATTQQQTNSSDDKICRPTLESRHDRAVFENWGQPERAVWLSYKRKKTEEKVTTCDISGSSRISSAILGLKFQRRTVAKTASHQRNQLCQTSGGKIGYCGTTKLPNPLHKL